VANSLDTALELIGMSREEFEKNIAIRTQIQQQMKSAFDAIIRGHITAGSAQPERVHSLANAAMMSLVVGHYVGCFFDCDNSEKLKIDLIRATADLFNESYEHVRKRKEEQRKAGLT